MHDVRHLISSSVVVLFAVMATATTKSQRDSSRPSSTQQPAQPRPSTAAPGKTSTDVPTSANKGHNLLARASEAERNFMLATAVQTAGDSCREGRRNFFQGFDQNGNATWNVECSDGKSFAVMVYDDATGSTKVLECRLLKTVAKVDCFKKF